MGIITFVALWHWHQQQKPLKQPQMKLQGLLLTVREWFNPPTPQQVKASLKEQAGSLPHFLPASQLCFSEARAHESEAKCPTRT